ncbi:MAG: hypothetical protein M1812_003794 [Candelaria pacifica]|nr:MAG: hypothetical protein M1812_003794 [Candelaria pacifica]
MHPPFTYNAGSSMSNRTTSIQTITPQRNLPDTVTLSISSVGKWRNEHMNAVAFERRAYEDGIALRDNAIHVYQAGIVRRDDTIANRDDTIAIRDDTIMELKEDLGHLHDYCDELEGQGEDDRGEIARLRGSQTEVEAELQRAKNLIAELEQRITRLEEQKARVEEEKARVEEEKARVEEEKAFQVNHILKLNHEIQRGKEQERDAKGLQLRAEAGQAWAEEQQDRAEVAQAWAEEQQQRAEVAKADTEELLDRAAQGQANAVWNQQRAEWKQYRTQGQMKALVDQMNIVQGRVAVLEGRIKQKNSTISDFRRQLKVGKAPVVPRKSTRRNAGKRALNPVPAVRAKVKKPATRATRAAGRPKQRNCTVGVSYAV